jgi:hypothetical protein
MKNDLLSRYPMNKTQLKIAVLCFFILTFMISSSLNVSAVFQKVATFTGYSADEYQAQGMATSGGYLYVATYTEPFRVLKIDLSTFTRADTYEGWEGENFANIVIIIGNFLYVSTDQSPSKIVKIDLTDFSRVDSVTLEWNESQVVSLAYSGDILYAGCWTSPAIIVRIDLTSFTRIDALTLEYNENVAKNLNFYGDFLYVGLYLDSTTAPGRVVKINMTDFTRVSAIDLESGEGNLNTNLQEGDIVYYSCFGTGKLLKFNLTAFEKEATLPLSELALGGIAMKSEDDYLYVGVYASPAKMIRIVKSTFTEKDSITFGTDENYVAEVLGEGDYLYAGCSEKNKPLKVLKVDITANAYLQLGVEPNQATYARGQSLTFTVNVFNQLNPELETTLTFTVTGPGGYYFFDFQRINVAAGSVDEHSFDWKVPTAAGTYIVEVSLIPARLTAYDAMWLEAT